MPKTRNINQLAWVSHTLKEILLHDDFKSILRTIFCEVLSKEMRGLTLKYEHILTKISHLESALNKHAGSVDSSHGMESSGEAMISLQSTLGFDSHTTMLQRHEDDQLAGHGVGSSGETMTSLQSTLGFDSLTTMPQRQEDIPLAGHGVGSSGEAMTSHQSTLGFDSHTTMPQRYEDDPLAGHGVGSSGEAMPSHQSIVNSVNLHTSLQSTPMPQVQDCHSAGNWPSTPQSAPMPQRKYGLTTHTSHTEFTPNPQIQLPMSHQSPVMSHTSQQKSRSTFQRRNRRRSATISHSTLQSAPMLQRKYGLPSTRTSHTPEFPTRPQMRLPMSHQSSVMSRASQQKSRSTLQRRSRLRSATIPHTAVQPESRPRLQVQRDQQLASHRLQIQGDQQLASHSMQGNQSACEERQETGTVHSVVPEVICKVESIEELVEEEMPSTLPLEMTSDVPEYQGGAAHLKHLHSGMKEEELLPQMEDEYQCLEEENLTSRTEANTTARLPSIEDRFIVLEELGMSTDVCGETLPSSDTSGRKQRAPSHQTRERVDTSVVAPVNTNNPYVCIDSSGKKILKCDLCPKTFSSKITLQRHRKLHSGKSRYECTFCGKKNNVKGNHVKHMRVHTGERPYPCSLCHMAFSDSSNLGRHMDRHRNILFHCNVCHKAFKQKYYLAVHLKKEHRREQL